MKKLVKTIAIVVLMAISATGFAQTNDVGNESNDSNPAYNRVYIYAYVPMPTYWEEEVEQATATITWYDALGSCYTYTTQGEQDLINPLKWSFQDGTTCYATYVTYKIVASNGAGTIGWIAEGTHYLCNGDIIIVTDWQLKWNTVGPNDPGN